MSMPHTDLIVLTDRTAPIAAIVPIDQALTEAMHLIPQAATAVMALILLVIAAIAHIVIIIPTLQEVISQVVIRVEVQAQQV